jgi:type IV fimbrial biogenesis protein FimT
MSVNQVSEPWISAGKPASCKLRCVSSGSMTRPCNRRYSRGLTLMELLIVMGIVGILVTIAIPSYLYVTSSNRVASEVNALVGDLMFARSEAIKEGQPVVVCAAASGSTPAAPLCATSGAHWEGGWIVFSDLNNDQTIDGNDVVMRIQPAFTSKDTFIASSTIFWISFNREGFASATPPGLVAATQLTLHTTPSSSASTRCLSVNQVGMLSVQPYTAGTCT